MAQLLLGPMMNDQHKLGWGDRLRTFVRRSVRKAEARKLNSSAQTHKRNTIAFVFNPAFPGLGEMDS